MNRLVIFDILCLVTLTYIGVLRSDYVAAYISFLLLWLNAIFGLGIYYILLTHSFINEHLDYFYPLVIIYTVTIGIHFFLCRYMFSVFMDIVWQVELSGNSYWKSNSGPLEEQCVLLITDSFVWSLTWLYSYLFVQQCGLREGPRKKDLSSSPHSLNITSYLIIWWTARLSSKMPKPFYVHISNVKGPQFPLAPPHLISHESSLWQQISWHSCVCMCVQMWACVYARRPL